MQNKFENFKSWYVFSFFILLSSISCSSEEPAPLFEALFKNLENGVGSEDECVSFQDYSIRMLYEDIDYSFEVFAGKMCSPKQELVKSRLPAEALLAGEWRGFIVIDNGTGSASRRVSLFDPSKMKNHFEFDYVDNPIFNTGSIDFFSSKGKIPNKTECPGQYDQYDEWKRLQFGIEIAVKNRYSLEKNETILLGQTKCIFIE